MNAGRVGSVLSALRKYLTHDTELTLRELIRQYSPRVSESEIDEILALIHIETVPEKTQTDA